MGGVSKPYPLFPVAENIGNQSWVSGSKQKSAVSRRIGCRTFVIRACSIALPFGIARHREQRTQSLKVRGQDIPVLR